MGRAYKISPEIADIMFSLWMDGFTYEDIHNFMLKQGTDYKTKTIKNLGIRAKWAERRQALISVNGQYYDEIIKARKQKQIQAWALVIDAFCSQIISDYIDYKQDPVAFRAAINNGLRPKPIWEINTAKEAQVFLEIQHQLVGDFKKEPDTQISIQNNKIETKLLSDDERRSLLFLLAQAKEQALMERIASSNVEIEKVTEKCTKRS